MEFLMQAIRRSTLIEEAGESLVPESTLADGTRRALVEVVLPEGMGVSGLGRICSAVQATAGRRDRLASDFCDVDSEDESSGSWLGQQQFPCTRGSHVHQDYWLHDQ